MAPRAQFNRYTILIQCMAIPTSEGKADSGTPIISQTCGSSAPGTFKHSRKCGLPNQVLSSDNAGGDGVAKGVQLDLLVTLKVLLSKENVEVGSFLN